MTIADEFRALHERPEPFLLPNPWDAGTARLLAGLGFEALATTSLGVANVVASRTIPAEAAKMIEAAADAGAVGASIEDLTNDPERPVYDLGPAADRVRAAVETARARSVVLTARCENQWLGVNDLADTIRRLRAYEEAGADVLYAPGLRTLEEIRAVVTSVGKPVNVVMGFADPSITLDQLAGIGVRRASSGFRLNRAPTARFSRRNRQLQPDVAPQPSQA
ncbi:isocitrate lyase/PEP mutase family protein [Amycolatopsis sp. CA-126428]|uniref:isocitrate lyase/PEP mutase family protein n=1 Tax=Amycolatopsis sp. CA-126428 TaxID=2073158 RepID=UPI000CD13D47|nr:isocitrate lyase/phosphoenolpyruvate mutase family protein [Amycolatopsis sp. CA-126428]